ncbi:MAG TPA: luciferase family protein [Solirubrobacteraceae bacterium]|nr:luciferase family protein [Solirubrobacteraceae bacterium]
MSDAIDAQTPSAQITAEVGAWPGVTSGYGRRGEFAFRLNGRELGHLHGDHAAHFFFSPEEWEKLYAEGRIGFHPVFPDRRGPAARRIEGPADVQDVIAMMRLNYERIAARVASRAA